MMLQSRIFQFYNDINELIVKHNVECISLETPYLGENAQSFLKLGYLRGIIYLICEQKKIILREFAPTVIKQQVTGSGRATKEEVQAMIKQLFPKIGIFETLDASDAVAIALCGAIKRD
jgi:crossover junction endodeoxyribonuclease RuvC